MISGYARFKKSKTLWLIGQVQREAIQRFLASLASFLYVTIPKYNDQEDLAQFLYFSFSLLLPPLHCVRKSFLR
jgi:hypothetical protein